MASAIPLPLPRLPPPTSDPLPPIRIGNKNRPRGPHGIFLFGATIGIVTYGFIGLAKIHATRREDAHARRMARIAVTPYLEAENDLRIIKDLKERDIREKQDVILYVKKLRHEWRVKNNF